MGGTRSGSVLEFSKVIARLSAGVLHIRIREKDIHESVDKLIQVSKL